MFKNEIEIFYEDTDCGGAVYYANYLKYFERARTLALLDRGIDPGEWMKKNVVFTVFHAEVDYKSPAAYRDTIVVETSISNVKGCRLTFSHVVTDKKDGRIIVTGLTKMACVNEKMKPRRIPDEIIEKVT